MELLLPFMPNSLNEEIQIKLVYNNFIIIKRNRQKSYSKINFVRLKFQSCDATCCM